VLDIKVKIITISQGAEGVMIRKSNQCEVKLWRISLSKKMSFEFASKSVER
jgi:hypothetical protein